MIFILLYNTNPLPVRPTSYTLGLGFNKISLVVVDISHTVPWLLTTYTLNIFRNERSKEEKKGKFRSVINKLQVCSLKQVNESNGKVRTVSFIFEYLFYKDCDLQIYPRDVCGLQSSKKYTSWKDYQESKIGLPLCGSSRIEGRWMIPCSSCRQEDTCLWSRATWDPFDCRYLIISRDRLKKCLTNKKVRKFSHHSHWPVKYIVVAVEQFKDEKQMRTCVSMGNVCKTQRIYSWDCFLCFIFYLCLYSSSHYRYILSCFSCSNREGKRIPCLVRDTIKYSTFLDSFPLSLCTLLYS